MDTETLDKIYLEWSQFTKARTLRERTLAKALQNFLDSYIAFEACGDAGHWDVESEKEIIAVRAALAGFQR